MPLHGIVRAGGVFALSLSRPVRARCATDWFSVTACNEKQRLVVRDREPKLWLQEVFG